MKGPPVVQGTVPRELCHSEWIMGMVMGSGRYKAQGW